MNIDDKIIDGLFKVLETFTELTRIEEKKRLIRRYLESSEINYAAELKYNSIFDEAYEMANNLNEIDDELVQAAQHTGKYIGEYSADFLLGSLCKIMYKSLGYHKQDKYNTL